MTESDTTEKTLEAERIDGIYDIEVRVRPGPEGTKFLVESPSDEVVVNRFLVNGRYVGVTDLVVFEADDYELRGETLHLTLDGPEEDQ